MRMEERKHDDGDLDGVSSDANKKKLKASDVYSDDSGSDSDSGSDFSADKHGASGNSSFPSSSNKRQHSSSSSSSSDSDVSLANISLHGSLNSHFCYLTRRAKKVARRRNLYLLKPKSSWVESVCRVTNLKSGFTHLS